MDLGKPKVDDIFSAYARYEIPAYQREYQWDESRWEGLWQDLGLLYLDKTSGRNDLPPHFIGAIIVSQSPSQPGLPTTNSVIDGQQRLVTLSVLLAAIRDAIAERAGTTVVQNHRLFWLRNENEEIVGPRLAVQQVDHSALRAAMNGEWRAWYPTATSKRAFEQARVLYAYTYFRFLLWQGEASFRESDSPVVLPRYKANQAHLTAEDYWQAKVGDQSDRESRALDLATLNTVVRQSLFLLNIVVEPQDEDGPTIFDTMNAKRTQLDQWDFIRNSVFIRLHADNREKFFQTQWSPAQDALFDASYSGLRAKGRDAFVYDYLIARGEAALQGTINRNRGHEQLMARIAREAKAGVSLRDFVADDFLPAAHAWICATGANKVGTGIAQKAVPPKAQQLRDSVMALSSGPPIPVMLHYFDAWAGVDGISDHDLIAALRILEAYVARHVMCQTPMSPFRAHFMQVMVDLAGAYDPAQLYRSLQPRWKSDAEVRAALAEHPMYGPVRPAQLGAIFRGLEQQLGGPGGNALPFGGGADEYSVEHVYPKSFNEGPNKAWADVFHAESIGAEEINWMAAHRHFIGNLTVVTRRANSKLRVAPFPKKRRAIAGDDPNNPIPPLAVNADIIDAVSWSRHQVVARSLRLTDAALLRWPTPDL